MTVKELINALQDCREQDAQVYFSIKVGTIIGGNTITQNVKLDVEEVSDSVYGRVTLYPHND